MAQINKPSDYFNTKLYTGDGSSSHAITGVGFAPDWVWQKIRNGTNYHVVFDNVRGATKIIYPNVIDVENTSSSGQDVISLDSDGFTLGVPTQAGGLNPNGGTCVAWNWKANGSGSSNTDGSVSATVSANTTAGFSIVEYTTASSGTQTMGHGLGSAPTFIITKPAQNTESWYVYIPTGVSTSLRLNTTAAAVSSSPYAGTPTDTLFSINNGIIGGYTGVISYCFTDVKGYSKFGSYTGNGNADGTFVYTGFKPAFVMLKNADATTEWVMMDNKRDTFNVLNKTLNPNNSDAEATAVDRFDFLSNGFKNRASSAFNNDSGVNYIYMAFAEEPLVGTNNIPATAR